MSFVLAIDQGTTSSRAMVFRGDISIAAVAQQEFPQHFPASGWVEHEPDDIWTSTVMVCREALEKASEISLEEFLESARHKLGPNLTPVTPESFAKWKKERQDKRVAEEEAQRQKKATQAQANKLAGLSGREMFALNPDMFGDEDDGDDDDGALDMTSYMPSGWEQGRDEEAPTEEMERMRVEE